MTTDPKREALAAEVKRLVHETQKAAADSIRSPTAELREFFCREWTSLDAALHAAIDALSQPPEGEGRAEPVAQFADSRVKLVYDLLCDDNDYPNDPAQHWEGWIARRIVDALTAPSAGHGERWVSVFDELPSTSGSVLVFSCTGAFRVESARFVRELHASLEPGEDPAFTHWMPLPPTPKDNRHE